MHGIAPVFPVVPSGTGDVIVGDVPVQQFLMEPLIHGKEKVAGAAINDQGQAFGLYKGQQVDHGVLLPMPGIPVIRS